MLKSNQPEWFIQSLPPAGMNTVYHKGTIKVLKSQTCTQQYVESTTYSSVKNQNVIIKFRKIKWK